MRGVGALCINVEGSVHDCTLGQCDPETGSGVDVGLCQLHTPGKQRVWEQGKGRQCL